MRIGKRIFFDGKEERESFNTFVNDLLNRRDEFEETDTEFCNRVERRIAKKFHLHYSEAEDAFKIFRKFINKNNKKNDGKED